MRCMNTRIEYLYRDAGNFKVYGEAVLSGEIPDDLDLSEVLIDGYAFVPEDTGLPPLREGLGPYVPDLDLDWHEVLLVERTEAAPTVSICASDWAHRARTSHGNGS